MKKQHSFHNKKRNPLHFQIGLAVSLGLTLIAFEWQTTDYVPTEFTSEIIDVYEEEVEHIRVHMKPKQKLQPRKPNPHKVVKNLPNEKLELPKEEPIEFPEIPKDLEKLALIEGEIEEILPKIFEFPEVFPTYVGGETAMFKFLKDHIRFPKEALNQGKGGTIFVSFVVDFKGNVKEVKAENVLGYGLEEEAERVVALFPKWIPGMQGPRKVNVRMRIPIRFNPQ